MGSGFPWASHGFRFSKQMHVETLARLKERINSFITSQTCED